jgi:CTP synthase
LGPTPASSRRTLSACAAYGETEISERHRHRYEFNNEFKKALVEKGLRITGASPDGRLAEITEIAEHPWFLGCQFHPEFKSRPTSPHPLFSHFIRAALQGKPK